MSFYLPEFIAKENELVTTSINPHDNKRPFTPAASTKSNSGLSANSNPTELSNIILSSGEVISSEARKNQELLNQSLNIGKSLISNRFNDDEQVLYHLLALSLSCSVEKLSTLKKAACDQLSVFDQFGFGYLTTAMEPDLLSKAYEMMPEGRARFALGDLIETVKKSYSLNLLQTSLLSKEFDNLEERFEVVVSEVIKKCDELAVGKSLLIDFKQFKHAFRLCFTRLSESKIELALLDSKGGIENVDLFHSLSGVFYFFMTSSMLKHTAFIFETSLENWNNKKQDYLSQLLRVASSLAITHERTKEENSYLPILVDKDRWKLTKNLFSSLDPENCHFTEDLQTSQRTDNCFAKRLQSAWLYKLGKEDYKIVKYYLLRSLRQALYRRLKSLNILNNDEQESLKKNPDIALCDFDLKTIATRLKRVTALPITHSEQTFSFWQDVFQLLDHKIKRALCYLPIEEQVRQYGLLFQSQLQNQFEWNYSDFYHLSTSIDSNRAKTRRVEYLDTNKQKSTLSSKAFKVLLEKSPELRYRLDIQNLEYFLSTDSSC